MCVLTVLSPLSGEQEMLPGQGPALYALLCTGSQSVVGSGSAISVLTTLLVGGWSPAGSSIVLCSCVCREPLELLVGLPPAGDNGAPSCLPKGLHRRRLPITYIIPVLVETNTFHHIHCLREGDRLSHDRTRMFPY